MNQTELTRALIENKKNDSPNESFSRNISYAEAVLLSSILLIPSSNHQTLSEDKINEKMTQAFNKIKVASAGMKIRPPLGGARIFGGVD